MFIENFHDGTLLRFLKTNSVQYKHTHFYNSTDFQPRAAKHSPKPDTEIKIPEINSEDFEEKVIQSNKTVVVLFFTANCAFCSIISHSLMTASKILLPLQPDLAFLRIDGDKNELAWFVQVFIHNFHIIDQFLIFTGNIRWRRSHL